MPGYRSDARHGRGTFVDDLYQGSRSMGVATRGTKKMLFVMLVGLVRVRRFEAHAMKRVFPPNSVDLLCLRSGGSRGSSFGSFETPLA